MGKQKENEYLTYHFYNEKGELMGTLLTTEKIAKLVLDSGLREELKQKYYLESPKAHFLNYKNEDASNNSQRIEDWVWGYRN